MPTVVSGSGVDFLVLGDGFQGREQRGVVHGGVGRAQAGHVGHAGAVEARAPAAPGQARVAWKN